MLTSNKAIPYVYTERDTGNYVRPLVLKAQPGTSLLAYSTKASRKEYAEIWARVLHERGLLPADKSCVADENMTLNDIERTMGGPFAREAFESMQYVAEFGWDGGDPDVKSPEEVGVDIKKLTSLEQFVREEDWSPIL